MVTLDKWSLNAGLIDMKCTATGNENQDHTIQVIAQSVTVYQSVISVNRLYLIFPALHVVRTDNKD